MDDVRRVFDDLVRFETILWNVVDARLRDECGVALGSFNVMLVVAGKVGCRVQDVAAALAITVGGASQAVDRLEALGHCVRQPNPADRRSSVIALTAAGEVLVDAAGVVFDRELAVLLRGPLGARRLGALGESLAVLRDAADPYRKGDSDE